MALSKEEKEMRKDQRRIEKWNREHKIIDGVDHKLCSLCGTWFPSTLEYFYKNIANSVDGLNPECKQCTKNRVSISRIKKSEMHKETRRKYEQLKRKYINEKMKPVAEKFRNSGGVKKWQANNKDKLRQYREKRKVKDHKITKDEWMACKNYFDNSCAYCGLKQENHWVKRKGDLINMSLHKEHVDDEGCGDLENCVPACSTCNSSKHTTKLDEWYGVDNPNYVKERYDKIIKWIKEDHKQYIKSSGLKN